MRGERFVRRRKYNTIMLESLPLLLTVSIGLLLPPLIDFFGILFLFLLPLLRLRGFRRGFFFLDLFVRGPLPFGLGALHLHIAFGLDLYLA